MKDLKERTLRGGIAKVCAQGASFILRIGSLMVLARLLDPTDFGLVGMVTAVTGVFSLLKDAGLSMATVQRATITDEQVSTLFWINMLLGAILGLLSLAIAPVLASFYHEPRLFWVTAALASGFLFNAAGVQHSVLLQRQMNFTSLAVIEIISLLVSIAVGIGMAITGFGYWALVGMAIVSPAASTVCFWLSDSWVPGMPHRGVGISSMMRFGGMATLNGLVVYIAYNLEKVLLGRFWGAETLGIYGRAYQLINIPTENLISASGGVVFAALSRLQDDPNRFKNYFLKGYSVIIALTLPITIACALFANDIILILLGPKWKETIVIFQLLTPTILVFALINPFAWLLYSIGLVGRSLKIALVIAPLVIVAYVIGLPYGPRGVAFAYSAVMTLWLVPHIAWCIHGTMISGRDILKASSQPFLSAIMAAAVAFAAQFFYGQLFSPLLRLLLGGGIVLVIYLWMLLYVMGQKTFYLDLFQGLRKRPSVGEKDFVKIY
jgi:O-antigen/teichoic acid export membrane protein